MYLLLEWSIPDFNFYGPNLKPKWGGKEGKTDEDTGTPGQGSDDVSSEDTSPTVEDRRET